MDTEARPDQDLARYNAARGNIGTIDRRIDRVNDRLEMTTRRMDGVPRRLGNVEEDLKASSSEMERLQYGQRVHAMKLELLEKELEHVKLGNDVLLNHLRSDKNDAAEAMGNDRSGDLTDRSAEFKTDTPQPGGMYDQTPREPTPRAPQSPRRDMNGTGTERATLTTAERKEQEEDKRWERMKGIYGPQDSTSINPQYWTKKPAHRKQPYFDHQCLPCPGGLLMLRFDDVAYGEVRVVLMNPQQSICRNAGGYPVGKARKENIFVYEEAVSKMQNWRASRHQKYKDVRLTENCIVLFWFTMEQSALQFMENTHGNRFRESCWPTGNGYDAAFLPLNSPPPTNPCFKTFFVLEFLEAVRYDPEDMTQFEAEVRSAMSREVPECLPMVVSSMTGNVIFKPGCLVSPKSKVYISRFESQRDVDRIWEMDPDVMNFLRLSLRMFSSF